MLNNAYSFAADRTNHLRANVVMEAPMPTTRGGLFDWMAGYSGNGTTNIFWRQSMG